MLGVRLEVMTTTVTPHFYQAKRQGFSSDLMLHKQAENANGD
ncbi:hypothetical protein Cha6605_6279 (plasmid) [Chamaesiphon minutus PCC 6605]|uniref:Uncharacterized protein n=2 Tax=Chamaesiphon TaxID=217161 RepID=K9UQM6_CHAP6|nr:hypothetical protein Cha6605_6279 [Chamaesiphon minutus PCC 6605]